MNENKLSAMSKIFAGFLLYFLNISFTLSFNSYGITIPVTFIIGAILIVLGIIEYLKVQNSTALLIAMIAVGASVIITIVSMFIPMKVETNIQEAMSNFLKDNDSKAFAIEAGKYLKEVFGRQSAGIIVEVITSALATISLACGLKNEGESGEKLFRHGILASSFYAGSSVSLIAAYALLISLASQLSSGDVSALSALGLVALTVAFSGLAIARLVFAIRYLIDLFGIRSNLKMAVQIQDIN